MLSRGDSDSEVLFKQCSAVMPATTIDRRIRRQGGNPYHLTEAATKNAAAEAAREHRGHRRRGARKSRSRSGRRTVRPGGDGRRRRRLSRAVAAAAAAAVKVLTTAAAAAAATVSAARCGHGCVCAHGLFFLDAGRTSVARCGHGCERGDGGGTTRSTGPPRTWTTWRL